jgi:pyridoxamine 5'-phosphate oxidase
MKSRWQTGSMADFAERTNRLSLAGMREEYHRGRLTEEHCETNPIVQFENWFKDAQATDLKEPNAMTLATATPDGRPSARVVLLKEVSDIGFVFYTNYTSRKARELEANPLAALTFYWAELERQVRVEGRVAKVPRAQSEAYFRVRPKGSRLGAWASHQSEILPIRQPLERRLAELEELYGGTDDVPVPEFWGGYCVDPEAIEFWEGRPNRLHDRLLYRRKSENAWTIQRLSP